MSTPDAPENGSKPFSLATPPEPPNIVGTPKPLSPDPFFQFSKVVLDAVASGTPTNNGGDETSSPWRSKLERCAQDLVVYRGFLDAGFNPALLVRLQEIEQRPHTFRSYSNGGVIRVADWSYGGMKWDLQFVIHQSLRSLYFLSIEPESVMCQQYLDSEPDGVS